MFTEKNKNLANALAPIEKAAGDIIRKLPKDVREDAYLEGYIAYKEKKDIAMHIKKWWKRERRYHIKEQTITGCKPQACDLTEIKELRKDLGY